MKKYLFLMLFFFVKAPSEIKFYYFDFNNDPARTNYFHVIIIDGVKAEGFRITTPIEKETQSETYFKIAPQIIEENSEFLKFFKEKFIPNRIVDTVLAMNGLLGAFLFNDLFINITQEELSKIVFEIYEEFLQKYTKVTYSEDFKKAYEAFKISELSLHPNVPHTEQVKDVSPKRKVESSRYIEL